MYSILDINNREKSVYKSHNSNIRHDEFMDVHSNEKAIWHNMSGIKSLDHKIYTQKSDRISLSCYYGKRHIIDDGNKYFSFRINTYSHSYVNRT